MLANISRFARCANIYSKPLKTMKPLSYSGFFPKNRFSSLEFSAQSEAAAENLNVVKDTIAGLRGAPEQILIKNEEARAFEHCYVDEVDVGNVTSALQPLNDANTSDISEMASYLAPGTIYEYMDHASRDLLLYFSHDLGLGMGWAIIAISFGIRLVFTPLLGKIQLNAIKMKLLEPEMKNFQNTTSKFQRMGDFNGMKQARANFSALRERYGLSNMLPVLSLVQIPFLITWFVSLRYVANTPDLYPNIKTDGFLWFQDLSVNDPYFILPLISAVISYHNIQISTYNASSAAGSPLARYSRYVKYVPFIAMPFAVFFPSALNLYWIVTALCQLVLSVVIRSKAFRNYIGIPEYLPGSILEKLHGVKKPDIVKTVFNAPERPTPVVSKPILDAVGVKLEPESLNSKANVQVKPPQQTEKVTPATPAGGKTVEVFANKPKGKKGKN